MGGFGAMPHYPPRGAGDSSFCGQGYSLKFECHHACQYGYNVELIMAVTLEDFEKQALQLSQQERGELIRRLIISLENIRLMA